LQRTAHAPPLNRGVRSDPPAPVPSTPDRERGLEGHFKHEVNWREVLKFLSGAFFVTAGASWYFYWTHVSVPFFGLTMTPEFLGLRGFIHFGLFLASFYFGIIKRPRDAGRD
jgi:hypothetical protein